MVVEQKKYRERERIKIRKIAFKFPGKACIYEQNECDTHTCSKAILPGR